MGRVICQGSGRYLLARLCSAARVAVRMYQVTARPLTNCPLTNCQHTPARCATPLREGITGHVRHSLILPWFDFCGTDWYLDQSDARAGDLYLRLTILRFRHTSAYQATGIFWAFATGTASKPSAPDERQSPGGNDQIMNSLRSLALVSVLLASSFELFAVSNSSGALLSAPSVPAIELAPAL